MEVSFTLIKETRRYGRSSPAETSKLKPVHPRIPRLSRLMALAIRFEDRIRDGSIRDQATLARLGGVSRARLTQIMQLLHLAPDIQEQLLFLPGSSQLTERMIRPVLRLVMWSDQRLAFERCQKPNEFRSSSDLLTSSR